MLFFHRALVALGLITISASTALAHSPEAEDLTLCRWMARSELASADAPATLTIISPREGEVLRSKDFELLFTMQGDLAGARLDHVHWQLSEFSNNTAPDLSGVVSVSALREGDHTLTVYMATPEHVVITQKYTVHFRIATQGALFLAPENNATLQTFDVPVNYSTFGTLPDGTQAALSLDDDPPFIDVDGDGAFTFQGVTNGTHSITVKLLDGASTEFGDGETRTVVVQSPLNNDNADKAYSRFKRALSASSGKARANQLKNLRNLLTQMNGGGDQNPSNSNLNKTNIDRALRLTERLIKKPKDKKLQKQLKSLLQKMSA